MTGQIICAHYLIIFPGHTVVGPKALRLRRHSPDGVIRIDDQPRIPGSTGCRIVCEIDVVEKPPLAIGHDERPLGNIVMTFQCRCHAVVENRPDSALIYFPSVNIMQFLKISSLVIDPDSLIFIFEQKNKLSTLKLS